MPNITLNTENTTVDKNIQSLPSVSYEACTIFCATCDFIGKYHRALVQRWESFLKGSL